MPTAGDSVDADFYDPRYLAGVLLFNAHDFFEAHEVWEDMWADSHGAEHRFFQGLIQAAVGLCHFGNGNLGGAAKLYHSSRRYMADLHSPFLGLDLVQFWQQMEECFRPVLESSPPPPKSAVLDPSRVPTITLNPEPSIWPDTEAYLSPHTDEDGDD